MSNDDHSILTLPEHRERMLKAIADAWEQNPHLRLGQLVYTYVLKAGDGNIFYIKDSLLLESLRKPLE